MGEEVDFRLAKPADAKALLALLSQLQQESDTFLVDSNFDSLTIDQEAKQIKMIAQSKRNLIALAVFGTTPIGIVTVDNLRDNQGEVGVAVLKAYQGFTIGTNLVDLAIEWATTFSQLQELFLTVFESNAPAVHIYQKLGFKVTGKGRLHDRPMLEMRLKLADHDRPDSDED